MARKRRRPLTRGGKSFKPYTGRMFEISVRSSPQDSWHVVGVSQTLAAAKDTARMHTEQFGRYEARVMELFP